MFKETHPYQIYLITNMVTKKQYIGLTRNTTGWRWAHHVWSSYAPSGQKNKLPLRRAIRKYGEDAFVVRTLCVIQGEAEAIDTEERAIKVYKTLVPNGYNICCRGKGATGYKHTLEERSRRSARQKGVPKNPESVRKVADKMRGRKQPTWFSDFIKKVNTGIKRTPETIEKLRECSIIREAIRRERKRLGYIKD